MPQASFPIHQALAARHGDADVRWLAQSAEFDEALKPALAEIAVKFGARPAGRRCPEAFLLLPKRHGSVVLAHVADLGDPREAPAALGFHFLILARDAFDSAGAEGFKLLRSAPPAWNLRGSLPTLTGQPIERLQPLAEVEATLKADEGPLLLGSAQALLDGSRLAYIRDEPANATLEGLWSLLPYRSRLEYGFATYAFGNRLDLHALAAPAVAKEDVDYRYLSQEQAENYPEGRYELSLQIAVENGDEAALHGLLLRRTRGDTLKLGLMLLGGMVLASVGFGLWKVIRP